MMMNDGETQERSSKIDYLIKEIQANRLFEQNQELTNQQPCEFSDPNPLLVHHEFTLKEDGNREEELVLPGIGLGDYDTVLSRSNKGWIRKPEGKKMYLPESKFLMDIVKMYLSQDAMLLKRRRRKRKRRG
ncbi:hypothetical protein M0R45_026289 [Rubus argutus]|uniref:Uncharacterized protein n=1 Tax=Rubus argutus TaxID=59490 RepID=A0AAW1WX64_RUBAR